MDTLSSRVRTIVITRRDDPAWLKRRPIIETPEYAVHLSNMKRDVFEHYTTDESIEVAVHMGVVVMSLREFDLRGGHLMDIARFAYELFTIPSMSAAVEKYNELERYLLNAKDMLDNYETMC